MGRSHPGNGIGSAVLRPPVGDAASYAGAFIATKSAQHGRTPAAGLRATMSFYAICTDHERRDPEFHDDRAVGRSGAAQISQDRITVWLTIGPPGLVVDDTGASLLADGGYAA